MSLLILADDLTGAADSAARAFHAGLPATIFVAPPTGALPTGAVALSTDSRYLAPEAAAEQVRRVLKRVLATAVTWYKKIDSTLRGNIGAELDAMLDCITPAGARPCAVICPAFPAQGRGLHGGKLVFPQAAQALDLSALLTVQTKRPLARIDLADVRLGPTALTQALLAKYTDGAELLVVDALTEDDLVAVLAAVRAGLPQALLCGSAGLIDPLARTLVSSSSTSFAPRPQQFAIGAPVLVVMGSGSAMAHRQLDQLRAQGEFATIELGQPQRTQPLPKRGWVLHLPQPAAGTVLEGEAARQLVTQLAHAAVDLIRKVQPATLLLVGGDTAIHVLAELGIQQLTVLAELMPGIPLVSGIDNAGERWSIITKAGSFGDDQTLVNLFAGGDGR